MVNVAGAVAAEEHLDVAGIHPHDQRRRNARDLRQHINGDLPVLDHLLGHIDVIQDRVFWLI